MLKVHLVQIHYNLSYYNNTVDYIAEPYPPEESIDAISTLNELSDVENFLLETKSRYLELFETKINALINYSIGRGVNIIIFPEYSIPLELLELLHEKALQNSILIIGGTHRIRTSKNSTHIYQKLNILKSDIIIGTACSPIFYPNGNIKFIPKLKKSKWEMDLCINDSDVNILECTINGYDICFAVVPCIDSLFLDIIGTIFNQGKKIDFIVCPSYSPTTEPFTQIASIINLNECLYFYVNSADFGNSFVYLPEIFRQYCSGPREHRDKLLKSEEGIIEFEFEPKKISLKKGTITQSVNILNPVLLPIIYDKKDINLCARLFDLQQELVEFLSESEINDAIDWVDEFIAENASKLSDLINEKLKLFRFKILPLYDGNSNIIFRMLDVVKLDKEIIPINEFWAERTKSIIKILASYVTTTDVNINKILHCLAKLKEYEKKLPKILYNNSIVTTTTDKKKIMIIKDSGENDLLDFFQNRGQELDIIREIIAKKDIKIIVITGAIGIGKSEFINWMFRKQFQDWEFLKIRIPENSSLSRIIASFAYYLGIRLDIDALAYSTEKVFTKQITKLCDEFYKVSKRVAVFDDLYNILNQRNSRDYKLLQIFLKIMSSPTEFIGGRIFIISSQWLPEYLINLHGVKQIILKGIREVHIKRIIDYYLRKQNKILGEEIPHFPAEIYNLIKGHPLSAKLFAEIIDKNNLYKLHNINILSEVTGYIAKELLKYVRLDQNQIKIIYLLSVFRLPIIINELAQVTLLKTKVDDIVDFTKSTIINFDGNLIEIHEAVRRYFEKGASNSDKYIKFHQIALEYYKNIYENQKTANNVNPNIIAEIAYHLSIIGNVDKDENFKYIIIDELRIIARNYYKNRKEYHNALKIYLLLNKFVPNDYTILAYIGRCYARDMNWVACNTAFDSAITICKNKSLPTWWLYRDWGHIKARYYQYTDARRLFNIALAEKPNEISITSTLAFMYWQENDIARATELFENVLKHEPNHLYTLRYYSKMLDANGNKTYAQKLRSQITSSEFYNQIFNEYDLDTDDYEFEYDD